MGRRVSRTRTKDIKITEIKIFAQNGGGGSNEEEVGVRENGVFSLGVQEAGPPPRGVFSGIPRVDGWDDIRIPLTLRVCDLFGFLVVRNNQTR